MRPVRTTTDRERALLRYKMEDSNLHTASDLREYRRRVRGLSRWMSLYGMPQDVLKVVEGAVRRRDFATAMIELDPRKWWDRRRAA